MVSPPSRRLIALGTLIWRLLLQFTWLCPCETKSDCSQVRSAAFRSLGPLIATYAPPVPPDGVHFVEEDELLYEAEINDEPVVPQSPALELPLSTPSSASANTTRQTSEDVVCRL